MNNLKNRVELLESKMLEMELQNKYNEIDRLFLKKNKSLYIYIGNLKQNIKKDIIQYIYINYFHKLKKALDYKYYDSLGNDVEVTYLDYDNVQSIKVTLKEAIK